MADDTADLEKLHKLLKLDFLKSQIGVQSNQALVEFL